MSQVRTISHLKTPQDEFKVVGVQLIKSGGDRIGFWILRAEMPGVPVPTELHKVTAVSGNRTPKVLKAKHRIQRALIKYQAP